MSLIHPSPRPHVPVFLGDRVFSGNLVLGERARQSVSSHLRVPESCMALYVCGLTTHVIKIGIWSFVD